MHILLATDGSSHSQAAVAILKRIPFPPSSALTVLTVVEQSHLLNVTGVDISNEDRETLDRLWSLQHHEAERVLAREAAHFEATGWTVHTIRRAGHVSHQILEAANQLGVDLVVVGARGLSGIKRFLLGSVSQKVVKHAPCSVLIAKSPSQDDTATDDGAAAPPVETDSRLRILVAYDGSPSAQAAVKVLASLLLREHAEVTVTTVLRLMTYYRIDILQHLSAAWQEETRAAQAELETTAQALREATPYVATQLREGANPSQEILTAVRECNADLIVLGRKGKSGIERFLLGSVANRMADYAPCSVWLHQTA